MYLHFCYTLYIYILYKCNYKWTYIYDHLVKSTSYVYKCFLCEFQWKCLISNWSQMVRAAHQIGSNIYVRDALSFCAWYWQLPAALYWSAVGFLSQTQLDKQVNKTSHGVTWRPMVRKLPSHMISERNWKMCILTNSISSLPNILFY